MRAITRAWAAAAGVRRPSCTGITPSLAHRLRVELETPAMRLASVRVMRFSSAGPSGVIPGSPRPLVDAQVRILLGDQLAIAGEERLGGREEAERGPGVADGRPQPAAGDRDRGVLAAL